MPPTPYLYKQTIENLNDFDVLSLTEEDRRRGEMYYASRKREEVRKSETSIEGFLRSLKIRAVLRHLDEFSLPRVAQLTNKTNQFNLTTHRYTDEEIRRMNENKDKYCIHNLHLLDKFGDEGIVGVAIIHRSPQTWTADSFLMSCRVLGRGAETALLAHTIAEAKKCGVRWFVGEYVPTSKNEVAKSFYRNHGFELFQEANGVVRWRLDLAKSGVDIPDWIEVTDG
jgi:FkbH-like protein